MRFHGRFFVLLAVVLLLVAALSPVSAWAAGPLAPKDVPEPLKPWVPWVLHGKEEASCPVVQSGATCTWPSRLDLSLTDRGGSMRQEWRVDAERTVALPGDERRWPQDVRVDGKKAVVVPKEGKPAVALSVGTHRIEATFAWDTLPEALPIPKETGLLVLQVRGRRVASPVRDAEGLVWLQKESGAVEGDALEIVVHRRVEDEVPLKLVTRIQLAVAGKNREIVLGRALPPGYAPVLLDAQLPTRVEPDSRLRVQARAGSYVIELTARSEGPAGELERPKPEGPWREGDEVWVFQARPELRVVEVEGVQSIDPQQTTLTDAWKKLPAYPMKLGTKMRLVEKRRGDADPPPDQLTLDRRIWLDFEGGGMTTTDRLTGTLSRSMRLEMGKPSTLGRVAIRGKDQFITHLGDASRLGVEIRQGELDVVADSRIVGDVARVPAVGWNHDFSHVSARLFVPPGYRLFHASGVDEVPGTWLRHFTLLEIFLVLVLALATARLFGLAWGAATLITLILIVPEAGAPKWIWAVLLAGEALTRVIPEGVVKRVLYALRFAVAMVLVVIALPFLVHHVRQGMYPALGEPQRTGALLGGLENDKEVSAAAKGDEPAPPPAAPAAQNVPVPSPEERQEKPAGAPRDQSEDRPVAKKPVAGKSRAAAVTESASDGWSKSYGGSAPRQTLQNIDVYDPNAMVQTGPGLPSWSWTTLDLKWSGPVERSQELRLWLVGPTGNLVLALLRAALLVALVLRFMPFFDWMRRVGRGGGGGALRGAAAVATFSALLFASALAHADTPTKEMLDTLQERLLAPPPCNPQCASSSKMVLEASGTTLRIRMAIDVGAKVAVPLPGGPSHWLPERVDIDGKAATGLLLRDGKLYVALDVGSHDLVLDGPLPERETVQVPLPLKPRRVEADAKGWKLEGLHEDGLADDSLQLTRTVATAKTGGAMETTALPPFVHIERTLRIGLSWQVETRIVRASPLGAAIVLEVPLLAGESITTADVRVQNGKALVNMPAQAPETTWRSVLDAKSPVRLSAPKGLPWVETWRVDLSPVWHASFDGIPPVHPGPKRFATMPEWRPWPGEGLSLAIARPEGAAGQTITVDDSKLLLRPGVRSTDATLTLRLRASRGGQHSIDLPPGAILEALRIGGTAQPIRQDGRAVALPITPGAQEVQLVWREPRGIQTRFDGSAVDLHLGTVNAEVKIDVGGARWVLFAAGPRLGPAVLFWSLLLVLVVVALSLSRVRFVPLSASAWLLLAIGLSQTPVEAGAFVVGWLVALGARKHWPELTPGWFNLRQLALVLLTLVALGVLVVAVYQGLLGRPEMQIVGNGSSPSQLIWFDDRTEGLLPQPWVLSAPMLVYRLAMLAWALWLAFALLKWLRFGWSSFSTGGMWKELPRAPRKVWQAPPHAQQQWAAHEAQQQAWQQAQAAQAAYGAAAPVPEQAAAPAAPQSDDASNVPTSGPEGSGRGAGGTGSGNADA